MELITTENKASMLNAFTGTKSLRDHIQEQNERISELTGLLKDLEWSHEATPNTFGPFCPMCRASKDNGHRADCRLAKALREDV